MTAHAHRCTVLAVPLLVLALGSSAPAGTETLFDEVLVFPTGGLSFPDTPNIEVVDLNGDGRADVAFPYRVGPGADDVAVILQQADGTLALAAAATVGRPVQRARFGDLDGDGHLDLVAAVSGTSGLVLVRLGDGAGGFGPASSSTVGDDPDDVALGDLDGDGRLDAVTADAVSDTASVLIGLGDGTFAAAVPHAVGDLPRGVALGDIDEDGALDIAVANRGDGDVTLLLGDGDGGFSSAGTVAMPPLPGSVALADFDGDGHLDLAVGDDQAHTISVRPGAGDATFGAVSSIDVGGAVRELVVTDVDEDGTPDIAVSPLQGELGLHMLLLSQGDGTFVARSLGGASLSVSIGAGDLNHDGDVDLVTARSGDGETILGVLTGNGRGEFEPFLRTSEDSDVHDVAFGDMDGDGHDDLVAADWGQDRVRVHAGVGNGLFGAFAVTPFGDRPGLVELADFDADGQLDAVVGNRSLGTDSLAVLLGDGALGFGAVIDLGTTGDLADLLARDVDTDGDTDVIAVAQSEWQVYVNDGAAGFAAPAVYASQVCFSGDAVYADFTGDDVPDLGLRKSCIGSASVEVFPGVGDGTFDAAIVSVSPESWSDELAAGDLDEDGDLDVIGTGKDDDVVLLINDGGGAFTAGVAVPLPGATPRGAGLADLDGDGHLDLAAGEHFDAGGRPAVVVWRGHGDATFGPPTEHVTASRPEEVLARDVDGDGVSDLVVLPQLGDNIHLMRNLGGPWQDQGFAHAGEQGLPKLVGEGTLQAGDTVRVTLSDWRPNGAASLYLGAGALFAPFKGGTFVPTADVVITPFVVDATGDLSLQLVTPAGLGGFSVWMQFWGADPAASHGFAATNGMRVDIP